MAFGVRSRAVIAFCLFAFPCRIGLGSLARAFCAGLFVAAVVVEFAVLDVSLSEPAFAFRQVAIGRMVLRGLAARAGCSRRATETIARGDGRMGDACLPPVSSGVEKENRAETGSAEESGSVLARYSSLPSGRVGKLQSPTKAGRPRLVL